MWIPVSVWYLTTTLLLGWMDGWMVVRAGFTSLTEMLAEQGKRGVDKLTRHVSTYFGHIIEIVYKYGGDVIRFAGDALIVVFRSECSHFSSCPLSPPRVCIFIDCLCMYACML